LDAVLFTNDRWHVAASLDIYGSFTVIGRLVHNSVDHRIDVGELLSSLKSGEASIALVRVSFYRPFSAKN